MVKKFLVAVLMFSLFVGVLALTGCTEDSPAAIMPPGVELSAELSELTELPRIWEVTPREEPATIAAEFSTTNLLQLMPVTSGELLATMHTTMGDITLRFFPTEAPLAVENFLTHAWNGYYDGILFHRVIPDFMIQTGCPLGTGTGGESIWGGQFGQELSPELRHFRGALAMAQTAQPNSIGSQFYIVQNSDLDPSTRANFQSYLEMQDEVLEALPDGSSVTVRDLFPAEAVNYFLENGGTPHLDWHFSNNPHTVFGHVVSGMDVVDAIANTPATSSRPVNDVYITGFTFFIVEEGA